MGSSTPYHAGIVLACCRRLVFQRYRLDILILSEIGRWNSEKHFSCPRGISGCVLANQPKVRVNLVLD